MNSTQRSVWFRDFLPIAEGGETSNDAVVQSPVPLFSPSVTRDKTKVLHSVFSPQYNCAANQGHKPNRIIDNGVDKENAITSGNLIAHQAQFNEGDQESKPPLSKSPQADNLQHQTRHGRQVGTTPGMKINTTTPRSTYQKDIYSYHPLATSTKKPGLKINSSQSTFNWNTPQISPAMSSISGTTNRNIFRTNGSPASQKMKGDHQRDLNPLSSSPSSTSFYKDLPIRMLSIPNIQKCDSVTELTHIVTVLEKQNEYPSLLRFAKRRLTEARNKIECLKNTPSSHAGVLCPGADGKCIGTEHTNISPCSTEMERKQNDSSLVMSLSSDEDSDISSRGYKKITSFQQSQQKSLNAEEFLSDQPPEIQLRKQIQRLTQTIAEMENIRISEQTDFEEKIRCLNEAKEKAELKIITLEAAVLSDSARGQASHKQLIRSLEQLQKEKHTLQNSLSEERILRNENQKKASALEQRLLAEIKNLQSELKRNEIEVKKSRNTDKKQQELNQLLRSAQGKLEDMKKERDSMIRCMLEVIGDEGKGTKDVNQLSKQQRVQVATDCKKAFEQSRQMLDETRNALSMREANLNENEVTQRATEESLSKALTDIQLLQKHNIQLSGQIEELHTELLQTRKYHDQLLHSVQNHHLRELEKREYYFESLISSLTTKMHKGQQRDATRNHEVRTHLIEGINKKTAKLSEQLQIHGIKPSSRSTAPQSRSTNPVATILDYEDAMNCKLSNGILPYINAPRREDGIVCTTKSSESNFESSESMNEKATNREDVGHDQCTQRQLLIRSAGGRKALIDKLKKIRSPRIKQLS